MDLRSELDRIAKENTISKGEELRMRRALDEAVEACGHYLCKRETGTDNLEASESYRALRSALGEVKT